MTLWPGPRRPAPPADPAPRPAPPPADGFGPCRPVGRYRTLGAGSHCGHIAPNRRCCFCA